MEVEQQPAGLGTTVRVEPYSQFNALEFVQVLLWVPGQGPVVVTTTTSTTTTLPLPPTTLPDEDEE